MKIEIEKSEYDKILEHGKNDLPIEACGLLGGLKEKDIITIKNAFALENLDKSNEHFTMDAKEQFRTVKKFRQQGLILLGNYHSHPETPARMSEEDKKLAYDTVAIYGIVSLENNDKPVLKFFKIDNDKNTFEIEYKII